MKLSEIYKLADELAPKAISDELCAKYGMYDNSGVLVDVNEEIKGVLFALDLTNGAIDDALSMGANLIITHHPAIYGKISRINYGDEGLLGQKLIRCIRNGISVIAMHLNLDAATGGIDESLMEGVALCAGGKARLTALDMPVTDGAYGRAYEVNAVRLGALAGAMKDAFATERIVVYGDTNREITRVASFCGAGGDEGAVAFALRNGADALISSDFKHHVLTYAVESGLSVITLTHYASEVYGFRKYYEKMRREVKLPCGFRLEESLL